MPRSEAGWYLLGSSSSLLGFGSVIIMARCQILVILDEKQMVRKTRSNLLVLSPWCRMNSGWILLTPTALFDALISSVEKSPERMRSVLGAW